MYKMLILFALLFWCAGAYCDDGIFDQVRHMRIGGKLAPIVPSPEFVKRGKNWKFGDPVKIPISDLEGNFLKKISDFTGANWKYSGISFERYGDPQNDLWYVMVFYKGENEDFYIVIFNMKGEMWPLGKSYDPFEGDPYK